MTKLIRTTVTGALVFILPIGVIAFFVGKIVKMAHAVVDPIAGQLPVQTVAGISATILVAILGIILVSFLAGLFARSRLAQGFIEQMETHLLHRMPAYGLIKALSKDMITPGEVEFPVVLVHLGDAWQAAVLIEPTADGRHSVLFVPSAPTPQSGAVVMVENDRIRTCDIPLSKVYSSMLGRGVGLGAMVKLA